MTETETIAVFTLCRWGVVWCNGPSGSPVGALSGHIGRIIQPHGMAASSGKHRNNIVEIRRCHEEIGLELAFKDAFDL